MPTHKDLPTIELEDAGRYVQRIPEWERRHAELISRHSFAKLGPSKIQYGEAIAAGILLIVAVTTALLAFWVVAGVSVLVSLILFAMAGTEH